MGGDNGAADGEEGEALPEPPGKKRRKGAAEEGAEELPEVAAPGRR